MTDLIRTMIESPYAGDVARNLTYARRAMRDSLLRDEAPLASHLLYTQPGILNDDLVDERMLGILCGFAWREVATVIAFYCDYGWSPGMRAAKDRAIIEGREWEIRYIGLNPDIDEG